MSDRLEVTVTSLNQKLQFSGVSRSNPPVIVDYTPPLGDGQGYTSLELLLVSLATCSASTVVSLLRQLGNTVSATTVRASGIRRTEHPTAFESIALEFTIHSPGLEVADVEKAIQLSRDRICPVWAMLKGNVQITACFEIACS